MKAWKTLLTAGLGILVAGACTVTVSDGEGDGFSDDDLELDDQQGFDEDDFFADDSEPTDTAGTEDPGQTDTAETGVADDMGTDMSQTDEPMATDDAGMPAPDDMMTDDMPTDDAGMPAPDDMMTDDTEPMCEVEVSPDDQCEQCMAQDCTTAFTACGCDPDCQLELDAMRACFADKNFEEMPPATQAEVDECGNLASDGTLLGDLAACVGAPYMGTDESFGRVAGDGTCTLVCYGLYSMEVVE